MNEKWTEDIKHLQYEEQRHFRKWAHKMPFLQFPSDWKIKIIPPYCNAMVRFVIEKESAWVSVYFDVDNKLGYYDTPYWEAYPYEDDVFRCSFGEEDLLLKAIEKSLDDQLKEKSDE